MNAVTIQDIIVLVLIIGGMMWLNKGKKQKQKETISDVFSPQKVDDDGFLVSEDGRYMVMLEVQPIPFPLKSPDEQAIIWSTFRNWLGMFAHPLGYRVQSHPYDLQEYFKELRGRAADTGDPLNIGYIEEQEQTFLEIIEEEKIQDQRCYIILETDNRFLVDVGVGIQNDIVNSLFKKAALKNAQDNEEIAKQELLNSLRVTQTTLQTIGILTRQLKREDVEEYLYGAINREMASLITLSDLHAVVAAPDDFKESLEKIKLDLNVLNNLHQHVS